MNNNNSSEPVIVGLGEILWDVFPDGARFGGAPANFACSVAGLAGSYAQVHMASAVGTDEMGRTAMHELEARSVQVATVARIDKSTGQVLVSVDKQGHASYEFAADCAWDNLSWSPELENLAGRTSAVCFGSLGQRSQRSRETIRKFVSQTSEDCLRFFDVNLRDPFWSDTIVLESLPLASAVKCNEDELPVLASLHEFTGSDRSVMQQLIQRYSLKCFVLTCGADGSLLMDESGECCQHNGVDTSVVDTVGAGDSFTAAVTLGLLCGRPLDGIQEWASRVAAYVCSQSGATPHIPAELQLSANNF